MKHISETREIECSQGTIIYILTRKPVKNINIRVKPDGKVMVSANKNVPVSYIDNLIRDKENFIFRAIKKFEERQKNSPACPVNYEDGEILKILGKYRKLQVLKGQTESVIMNGDKIILTVKDRDDRKHKEVMINKWLKGLETEVFLKVCSQTYGIFQKYGVKYPEIKIRKMKSIWGSCQPKKGIITLNSKLIEAPEKCIEYVVTHEFVHFLYPNHSRKFHEFMTSIMPDWKERKKELER